MHGLKFHCHKKEIRGNHEAKNMAKNIPEISKAATL
jgi:hypothetical protein